MEDRLSRFDKRKAVRAIDVARSAGFAPFLRLANAILLQPCLLLEYPGLNDSLIIR